MEHSLTHGIGLVFYFFLMWLSLQLTFAAWNLRRASPKWITLVNTRLMQSIRIKWLSLGLSVLIAIQIALVVSMLAISAWTGNPIRFD